MTKPSNFIVHSGYASLKNNANGTISLSIPNGSVVNAVSTRTFSTDITLGQSGGSIRARGRVNGGSWMPANAIGIDISSEIPAYGTGIIQQPATAYVRWVGANTVRLMLPLQNYADQPLYVRSAYTIEFKVNTFLPPS